MGRGEGSKLLIETRFWMTLFIIGEIFWNSKEKLSRGCFKYFLRKSNTFFVQGVKLETPLLILGAYIISFGKESSEWMGKKLNVVNHNIIVIIFCTGMNVILRYEDNVGHFILK